MSNWRYFQETGEVGGTLALRYVDSHNGDDATGTGTNTAPYKTIQKALDNLQTNYGKIVCAGYFREGDFIYTFNTRISFIAEGYVILDGSTSSRWFGTTNAMTLFNNDTVSGFVLQAVRDYGRFSFRNFPLNVIGNYDGQDSKIHNCEFINCPEIHEGIVRTDIEEWTNVLFVDSRTSVHFGGSGQIEFADGVVENCTFINSEFNVYKPSNQMRFRNNYFDATSKIKLGSAVLNANDIWAGNLFEGTLTDRIRVSNFYYDNTEDWVLDTVNNSFGYGSNDLPSTTNPLLNSLNSDDYTLQETSPLKDGGVGNQRIGAFGVANATAANDVTWTVSGVDNSTVPGDATLTGSPTGTLTSGGIQIAPNKRLIQRINLPKFEVNPFTGQMIGANLSTDNIPQLIDVEIQFSDDNVTYNGTWLKVPAGTQPLHDTTNNVGNDDALFDITTSVSIKAKYVKYRITLRDNDVII